MRPVSAPLINTRGKGEIHWFAARGRYPVKIMYLVACVILFKYDPLAVW
jgi:hypothetical protein